MFEDIIELMNFTLESIKLNKEENLCKEIYDVYRQLKLLIDEINKIYIVLSRDIDYEQESSVQGWIKVVNPSIFEYENLKYSMFCKLSKIDTNLAANFLSTSLNCKIDEYDEVTFIDK